MAGTPLPSLRAQAAEIIRRLRTEFPEAATALEFRNPWELTVAVILSAQCTDKMVNQVTAALFQKYRTLEDYAAADPVSSSRTSDQRVLP